MIERRQFLRAMFSVLSLPFSGCTAHHAASALCPGPRSDFKRVHWLGPQVWRIGPESGRAVVLLHELPGLTDDDLALARCLSKEGFGVYLPVLFGSLGQHNNALGLAQACLGSPSRFACSKLSARSAILDVLEPLCDRIAEHSNGPIGAIGMCLTGVLPLALLSNHVTAAVLCQPTLPFDLLKRKPVGAQLTDLGLGADDLREALASTVPFLAMHYANDPLSPIKRLQTLGNTFGMRAGIIELPGEGRHSSLAGDLDPRAFADTVTYLKVRLGVETGPKAMQATKLGGKACEIAQDGTWRAV